MDLQNILKKIYQIHIKKLNNLDQKNPKIMILFSGTAGSGKSFIAKRIEEKFKGIRINNDDIRDIFRDHIAPNYDLSQVDLQKLLIDYSKFLYKNISKINGFLILDSSMDRGFDMVEKTAETNKYKIFLIRLDLSEEILIKQIKQRIERDPEPYLLDLARQLEQHEKFSQRIVADYIISEQNFDRFENLFEEIDRRINWFLPCYHLTPGPSPSEGEGKLGWQQTNGVR